MMPGRTTEIVALLKHSKQILDEAVAGVTEEEAAARPNTGGWSILQVIEHVALAERGMLSRFDAAQKSETSLEDPAREARILAGGADRSTKMQAPETAGPAGRFETLQEACGQFAAAREKTIRFAEDSDIDLYRMAVAHPVIGTVNGCELLLIMAMHARRHAAQVAEIRASFR